MTQEPPRLISYDKTFPSGYGPRAIRLSRDDRNTLFVGCKDGSVTKIDLTRAEDDPPTNACIRLRAAGTTGVRSLCDLGNGWLLLGQDDGSLITLPWKEEELGKQSAEILPAHEGRGAIGYIGRWSTLPGSSARASRNDKNPVFIVSSRRADTFLLTLEKEPRDDGFSLTVGRTFENVRALSGYARVGRERWIVGKTGNLWWYGEKRLDLEPRDDLWDELGLERPGIVFDTAVVRTNPGIQLDHGIYLSTDEGVFLLRKGFQRAKLRIEPVYLPGITDICMGITHAVQGNRCYLWVADGEGSVHLFWSRVRFWENKRHQSVWKRSGLIERKYPVVQAIASWSQGQDNHHEAVISQACRDDRIVISWYLSHASEKLERVPEEQRNRHAELLSWGSLEELREQNERSKWSCEALIAEQIEEAGLDPKGLRRFLRNPGVTLASEALAEIGEDPGRAAQALTLWTHTLIGTVHRSYQDGRNLFGLPKLSVQDYLGIVRWLRRISNLPHARELLQQIAHNIQYVRKWGIFGRTYADRESVHSALAPLSRHSLEEHQFDRLVYESLLFHRRVDLVEALDNHRSPGSDHLSAPWDLRYLCTEGNGTGAGRIEYVAVSRLNGIALYRRSLGRDAWQSFDLDCPSDRALGGRILLGTCGSGSAERAFVLSCPVRQKDGVREEAQIQINFLEGGKGNELSVQDLFSDAPPTEAVYSLHALGDGRVVVGLERTHGTFPVALLRVTSKGVLEPLKQEPAASPPANYPEFKTPLGNPAGALASYSYPDGYCVLFVGCRDGQILRFCIESNQIGLGTPVGRLSAPVSALACAEHPGDGDSLRVFAGGADGTVVAYQAIKNWRAPQEKAYVTLWGFQMEGPVRSLHVLQSHLVADEQRPRGEAGDQNLVLAVTQLGKALLILDRPRAEIYEDPSRQKRLRFPGERVRELDLRSTVFDSLLLSSSEPTVLARLLVAPAAQAPRLITLHHPSRTPAGRKTIGDLRDRWLNSLRGPDRRIQGYLLRQPETTYAAAPELPAGMVRWILPYEPEARSWRDRSQSEGLADEGPAEQWLPRHLRPLVHLDTVWKQGDSLTGYLLKALLAAREIEDEVLFKEILEATLSRANHELFAADEKDLVPSATRFQALLADLEEVKGTWEGKSESLDLRMRITMIRSLLDGDTLWRLSHAGGEPAAKEALGAIIRLVHRSLGKGDLLLALETLRAVNVALLRLCQRLERRGEDQDWSLEDGSHLVPWTALYGFYQAIGDFAARMAHPKGTLGEVVSHEISRAYALGMIACPPAIAELAMWLAEADLPTDTSERVVNQVYLLGALLKPELRLSTSLHDLLLLAFGLGQAGSYYERALLILPTGEMKITNPAVFGRDNVRTAEARKPFDDIIVWLQALARQLIDDAGGVDLKAYQTLYKGIKDAPPGEEDQLHHSRHFWKKALEELAAACGRFPDLFPASGEEPGGDGLPLRPVRPELVLFSRTLGAWCQGQRKRLQELRAEYEIFEPASLLYDESLSLVERAAERFRHGAAVQKNLVLGVLGHGLLELMDEHLLEVWEIALALAPRLASEKRLLEEGAGSFSKEEEEARKKEPTSTAERFADYLLQRALKAEVIPKNLRSLQGLLSFTDQPAESRLTLKELFKEYETWEIIGQGEILETELNQRTYHFLNLTLNELQQNHRMHGLRGSRPTVRPGRNALRFEFCYPADSKQIERAHLLSRLRLQMMMPPREEPRVPSHGTGLYLANLAAGAVGWKLKTHRSLRDGVLRFSLIRRDKVTS